jgi:hypothetical protein
MLNQFSGYCGLPADDYRPALFSPPIHIYVNERQARPVAGGQVESKRVWAQSGEAHATEGDGVNGEDEEGHEGAQGRLLPVGF